MLGEEPHLGAPPPSTSPPPLGSHRLALTPPLCALASLDAAGASDKSESQTDTPLLGWADHEGPEGGMKGGGGVDDQPLRRAGARGAADGLVASDPIEGGRDGLITLDSTEGRREGLGTPPTEGGRAEPASERSRGESYPPGLRTPEHATRPVLV